MEDSQIIELYENRDEQAIVETSRKYRNYCQSISYNILHNTADCDECINDALHRLWNSIPPEHPTSFSSYLAKIVRNCSLDKYRYKKSRYFDQTIAISEELENCLTNHISAENIVEEKRIISLINDFLKNLDKEKRVMFVKRYWYFLSIEQISSDMKLTKSKIKVTLFRLRSQLEEYLRKEGVEI